VVRDKTRDDIPTWTQNKKVPPDISVSPLFFYFAPGGIGFEANKTIALIYSARQISVGNLKVPSSLTWASLSISQNAPGTRPLVGI